MDQHIEYLQAQLEEFQKVIHQSKVLGDYDSIDVDAIKLYVQHLEHLVDSNMEWMDDPELAYLIFDAADSLKPENVFLEDNDSFFDIVLERTVFSQPETRYYMFDLEQDGSYRQLLGVELHVNLNDGVFPYRDQKDWEKISLYCEKLRFLGVNTPTIVVDFHYEDNSTMDGEIFFMQSPRIGEWELLKARSKRDYFLSKVKRVGMSDYFRKPLLDPTRGIDVEYLYLGEFLNVVDILKEFWSVSQAKSHAWGNHIRSSFGFQIIPSSWQV